MRARFILVYTLLAVTGAPACSAALEILPVSVTLKSVLRIEDYIGFADFNGSEATGRRVTLQGLELTDWPAIHLILDISARKFADPRLTSAQRGNVRSLLYFASTLPHTKDPTAFTNIRSAVKQKATELLSQTHGRDQRAVVALFDNLDLWTGDDFWFFLQFVSDPEKLSEHRSRILALLPALTERQVDEFALELRLARPYSGPQLQFLLDLGALTEEELMKMLQVAGRRFVERELDLAGERRESEWRKREEQVFAMVIDRLAIAAGDHDVPVLSAVTKSIAEVRTQPASPDRELRLRFLFLVRSGRLKWMDQRTWRTGRSDSEYGQDNVIRVNFRPSCEDLFRDR